MRSSKKDDDNEIIQQIKDSLSDPLSEVEAVFLKTNNEAQEETERIIASLNQKSDWDEKSKSIQRAMSILKGNGLDFPGFDVHQIANDVSQAILDVRTTLVKFGTLFLSAAAQKMKSAFDACVNLTVGNLFKQVNIGKIFISGSCKYTILSIIENVQTPRAIKRVLVEAISKSPPQKQIVADSITVVAQLWPNIIVQPLYKDLVKHATTLSKDPSLEIRDAARKALAALESRSNSGSPSSSSVSSPLATSKRTAPKTPDSHFGSYKRPPSPRKHTPFTPKTVRIKSTLPKSGQNAPMFDISQVMPPENQESADQFVRLTITIIKSESYYMLEGLEFALPNSIIIASSLSTIFAKLIPLIPKLIDRMPDEFSDSIAETIIATKNSKRIIKHSFSQYGKENVIKNFVSFGDSDPTGSLAFFIKIYGEKLATDFDQPTIQFMRKLYSKESNVEGIDILAPFLSDHMDKEDNEQDELLPDFDNVSDIIKNGTYMEISKISSQKLTNIVQNQANQLKELLQDRDDTVIEDTLLFIIEFSTHNPKIDLSNLYDVLFALLSEQNDKFTPAAYKALKCITHDINPLLSYLQDEAFMEIALFFISSIFTQFPDEQIINSSTQIAVALIDLTLSPKHTIRRQSIQLCAHITQIAGKQYFNNLPALQQRMIASYRDIMYPSTKEEG